MIPDSWPQSVEILFADHVVLAILQEGALSSAVRHLSYYWEKEERKRLSSGPFRYNLLLWTHKRRGVIIRYPAFIFVII